jgi:hypothetical protein
VGEDDESVAARRLVEDREQLGRGVVDRAEREARDRPGFGMVLPVADREGAVLGYNLNRNFLRHPGELSQAKRKSLYIRN